MKLKTSSALRWLKDHWFILTALATAGVAWGQQHEKVERLDVTQKEMLIQNQKIHEVRESVVRQDEQIKQITKTLEQQNAMLRILIEASPAANKLAVERRQDPARPFNIQQSNSPQAIVPKTP